MLTLIAVVLLISWLGGFAFQLGGDLIHLLLVLAVVAFIANVISGRRAV